MLTYARLGKRGRFGNQLFEIASTIGMAISAKIPYGFKDWEYQNYFKNPLPKVVDGAVSLRGYLQNYKHFEDCEHVIRYYFTLKEQDVKVEDNTIFIHFRGYGKEGVTINHPEQQTSYYQKAVKYFPNKKFIVFSDDIERAKQVVQLDCEYRCGPEMEDFYMMTKCEGAIIGNSSFSWWAAYLGKGVCVMPKNWFTHISMYDDKGLFLKNWISL